MSNLVNEFALRLAKALAALILAAVLYVILTALAGAAGSVELALLCWLSSAALILLVEESPI